MFYDSCLLESELSWQWAAFWWGSTTVFIQVKGSWQDTSDWLG